MDVRKGIALILFGILVSMGGAITEGLGFCWLIVLPIGLFGLLIVLSDKSGKNS